ncbi:hypothetical protein ACP70R_007920 [Stipagrostis hirtigluma subsp. patula]
MSPFPSAVAWARCRCLPPRPRSPRPTPSVSSCATAVHLVMDVVVNWGCYCPPNLQRSFSGGTHVQLDSTQANELLFRVS